LKIIYEKTYVAFLDVLGFTEIVMNNKMPIIQKYFKEVNRVINELKKIKRKKIIGYTIISDSVIVSIPQSENREENIDNLRQLCIAVGILQKNLAINDIWLRGAISSGNAYFDDVNHLVVGPAYIKAYLLEGSLAINPRVLVDSKIINELGFQSANLFIEEINKTRNGGLQYSNWGSSVLFPWGNNDYIRAISRDVPLFIDYLCPTVESNNNELAKIITNLETNIYQDTKIYSKYRWVADYLKSVLGNCMRNGTQIHEDIELRIRNL
jgi:hypothetical protein